MKYYVIKDNKNTVAVVAHEYYSGSVYCRSKKKSFNQAFNAVCNKHYCAPSKDNNVYRVDSISSTTYSWMDKVLKDLCVDKWHIDNTGDVLNVESEIDHLVSKFLS